MVSKTPLPWSICLALGLAACATGGSDKPTERKFYKNPQVRRCLDLDRDRKATEAQACWAELLNRLESDPAFREASELSEADLTKVRQKAGQSVGRSQGLRRELDACFNISSSQRDERLACFQGYLKKHRARLSVAERYEVETAITAMKQARERVAGRIENTVEHAGKLLGGRLHLEDAGVRIDGIDGGALALAQAPEQGIIVALDGIPIAELDPAERIAQLEACQDRPVQLLIRQGGADQVTFSLAECRCGEDGGGKRLWQARMPGEVCTTATSPELKLGISWCYLSRDGLLEVEQVCNGSPADQAGVQPDHQYVRLNGKLILGMTPEQIDQVVKAFPATPIEFKARSGALQSPSPLTGEPLAPDRAARFWKAVQKALEMEGEVDGP